MPTPLKNMKVNWDDYYQYGKIKNVPNHHSDSGFMGFGMVIHPLVNVHKTNWKEFHDVVVFGESTIFYGYVP